MLLALLLAAASIGVVPAEPDADRDGLSDFHETHKYFTDPRKADSDGDGVPDGDWHERREFTYSVRAVMHVMAPFDVASMSDDYQDVRVLVRRDDLLEFEVVLYPFNTVAASLVSTARWSRPAAELEPFVAPGVCNNWDAKMRAQLLDELKRDGIDVGALDDAAAARAVSRWLLERANVEDSFTTFAVEFVDGAPRVSARQRDGMEQTLARFGRTLEQQFDRELFGKGMFETRLRGSCTSSAIYLSTGLRAIGLPTRTIVCTPIVDANDEREVAWIDARITHVGVRGVLRKAAERQRGSWTSHTFNEVFVGKRWRRLNYTELGQNVLDDDTLGLMVHVHTYGDHSAAGLVGWGNREAHPLHAQLFGGPNPYSCVSLSDAFGPHSKIPNEPLGALREALITRLVWYDDPARTPKLTTDLGAAEGAAYLFAHIDAGGSDADAGDYSDFFRDVDKHFVLRADGQPDVPAEALMKYWVDLGSDVNEFILRIGAVDFARMAPGVRYALTWSGGDGLRWRIAEGVSITRPRR